MKTLAQHLSLIPLDCLVVERRTIDLQALAHLADRLATYGMEDELIVARSTDQGLIVTVGDHLVLAMHSLLWTGASVWSDYCGRVRPARLEFALVRVFVED